MTRSTISALIILLAVLILGYASFYSVNEGERALLLRLGKIETHPGSDRPAVKQPGLHLKAPFITEAKKLDVRLQTLNLKSTSVATAGPENLIVEYYVKWRISDLASFYTHTGGDAHQAELLLEQQLNNTLRADFAQQTLSTIVANAQTSISNDLKLQAIASTQPLGITVVDARIKRIDLPSETSNAVLARMRGDYAANAVEDRAAGKTNATAIRTNAYASAALIVATAKEQAATIRGQGDAQAADIYANAYNKDPEFYAFYRSLIAYKKIFNPHTMNFLVLKPDSQFFKYFNAVTNEQKHG